MGIESMEQVALKINGMTCQGCARSVKRVLESVEGVQSADVSLDRGEARVLYDPSRTTLERMKAAVDGAGYQAP